MGGYPCLRCHTGEPFASVRALLEHVVRVHRDCPPDPHLHDERSCGCAALSFPSGSRHWLRHCDEHVPA